MIACSNAISPKPAKHSLYAVCMATGLSTHLKIYIFFSLKIQRSLYILLYKGPVHIIGRKLPKNLGFKLAVKLVNAGPNMYGPAKSQV